MPDFVASKYTQTANSAIHDKVVSLHTYHTNLVNSEAPDDSAIDDVLGQYVAALKALAATRSTTFEQARAKSIALATCIVEGRNRPAEIVGDYGLGASLIDDLIRLQGVITLGKTSNDINEAEQAPLSH